MEPILSRSLVDERALIEAAQRDPAAFAPLYERYVHRIFQYSLYRTGSMEDAEEVTAQTFLRALEYINRYRWRGIPFLVWLYRIANSIIVKSRRRPRAKALPWNLVRPPDVDLEEQELRQDLMNELYNLPERQQQILLLRFAQGLTYDEIALVVNRTPGAIRQLVYRALQTLRERMRTK